LNATFKSFQQHGSGIHVVITREMTDFPPVDPHPTLPAR
jgi:hypothetical protein